MEWGKARSQVFIVPPSLWWIARGEMHGREAENEARANSVDGARCSDVRWAAVISEEVAHEGGLHSV